MPEIRPRVNNDGHRTVIRVALPVLWDVMLSPEHCAKPPREQVKLCLLRVIENGDRFWGQWMSYTRKRTVEDLIIQFYYDAMRGLL